MSRQAEQAGSPCHYCFGVRVEGNLQLSTFNLQPPLAAAVTKRDNAAVFAIARSTTPPLDASQAATLAASLHRAAAAWTRTFLASTGQPNPDLADALCRETLAFGLVLLESRLAASDPAQAAEFLGAVRREVWTLHARRTRRVRRPELPDATGEATEFGRKWLARTTGGDGEFQITGEMFDEFCEFTGLASRELVGSGENLAALVFYIVIHGRVFASSAVPREQRLWLVRATRDCRLFLDKALSHWLHSQT